MDFDPSPYTLTNAKVLYYNHAIQSMVNGVSGQLVVKHVVEDRGEDFVQVQCLDIIIQLIVK